MDFITITLIIIALLYLSAWLFPPPDEPPHMGA
jgi:hypothetical protein